MPFNALIGLIIRLQLMWGPRGRGMLTCHDFGYGRAAGVPKPHPIHILVLGEVKNMTHSYTSDNILPISKIDPICILFFKFYPFIIIILFE